MATRAVAEAARRSGAKKLSAPERAALVKEVEDIKQQLTPTGKPSGDESAQAPDKLQNRAALESRKKHIEELLNKDDDLEAKGDEQRTQLSKRMRDLEAIIKKNALSLRQSKYRSMDSKDQSLMDYERAVKQQMAHQQTQIKNMQEWKDIRRRLDPQNPEADNINTLLYGT